MGSSSPTARLQSPLDKGWGLSRPSAATAAAAAVFFDPVACSNARLRISAFSVFLPSSPRTWLCKVRQSTPARPLRRCRRPSAPLDHQLRYVKSWFGATPYRRATKLTVMAGSNVSSGRFGGYLKARLRFFLRPPVPRPPNQLRLLGAIFFETHPKPYCSTAIIVEAVCRFHIQC